MICTALKGFTSASSLSYSQADYIYRAEALHSRLMMSAERGVLHCGRRPVAGLSGCAAMQGPALSALPSQQCAAACLPLVLHKLWDARQHVDVATPQKGKWALLPILKGVVCDGALPCQKKRVMSSNFSTSVSFSDCVQATDHARLGAQQIKHEATGHSLNRNELPCMPPAESRPTQQAAADRGSTHPEGSRPA